MVGQPAKVQVPAPQATLGCPWAPPHTPEPPGALTRGFAPLGPGSIAGKAVGCCIAYPGSGCWLQVPGPYANPHPTPIWQVTPWVHGPPKPHVPRPVLLAKGNGVYKYCDMDIVIRVLFPSTRT